MKSPAKLLTSALFLTSVFSTAAAAEEPVFPDAPSAFTTFNLQPNTPRYSYQELASTADQYRVLPPPPGPSPFESSAIGKIASHVDEHSSRSNPLFGFAMEYKLNKDFSFVAGTMSDPRKQSRKYASDKFAMGAMPDWQARSIGETLGMNGPHRRGNDGFAVGLKFQLR